MSRGNVLVLLAHNDDEYFVSAAITRERAATNEVHVLYTTHGSAYGVPTGVREAESTAALTRLGVSPTHIRHIGRECGIRDGTALENLLQLSNACRDAFPGVAFSGLLTVAWEGGHPDHDAVNLVAARVCAGLAVHEFSLYRRQRGVVVKAAFPSEAQPFDSGKLDAEALRLRRVLARANASQLPELLVLGAVAALRGTLAREPVRTLPAHDYLRPPGGRPLYEFYTRRRFSQFRAAAERFMDGPAP